jgi:hypothetical protein
MNPTQIVAILLIIGGALGLAYGGFTYTSDTHRTDIGPLHMKVTEKETINVPVWAGVGAIVAGGLMFGFGRRAV